MESNKHIDIEVVYALPLQPWLKPLTVLRGTTLLEAIHQSGLLWVFLDIDLKQQAVGIFGRICTLDTVVLPGDRVEVYRPLLIDPKEARRRKAT